jgi:2-methylisocitrate lyase-like PEP mutase family enzyme
MAVSRARRLRELIAAPELLVMPGAYDALSARLIARAGFPAVMAGGFAAAGALLGEPDIGQMTLNDYVEHYGRIADAVDVPVFVDADTGFGATQNVRRAVRAFSQRGIAGLFMEDQATPKRCGYMAGKALISADEMVAKIVAALDARTDDDFVITARTDAAGVLGFDAALERAERYAAAGADMIFVQGADDIAQVRALVARIRAPQLTNLSHASIAPKPSLAELRAAGAAAAIYPSAALFAAAGAVSHALDALRRDDSFAAVEPAMISLADYNAVVGLDAMLRRDDLTPVTEGTVC